MATPLSAVLIAFLLLAAGLAAAIQLEQLGRVEKLRQTTVQAQVLANGIAAPLAFEDDVALQEYLNALKADPQIVAVAAYDGKGAFAAGFARPPARLPRLAAEARSEEHTSELQSLMRISYAAVCLQITKTTQPSHNTTQRTI